MTLTRTLKATLLATTIAILPAASGTMAFAATPMVLQSFAPLVEQVKPAVVTVHTTGHRAEVSQQLPPDMEEFMQRFFGGRPGPQHGLPQRPTEGVGSGFIVASDGVIVTNNHVVEGADKITVILDDGTEYDAELVGRDDRVDIAVLRIDAKDLPTVAWGDSDAMQVGDWAIAIGNPLGLQGTVTTGIISARGRDINSGPYDDYLQVDAAINRGNSGGPLFDLNGNVIGVNTAIMSPSGGNIGLGFAIPAAQAQVIVADLLDDGEVQRGWIGVSIQGLSDEIANSLGLSKTGGALVADVIEGSPAEAAGLKAGDVILSFNDKPIEEVRDLTRAVAASEVGTGASIEVWRDAGSKTLTIRPSLLQNASLEAGVPSTGTAEVPTLGLTLEATEDGRLAIADVESGTPAEAAGLRPGDVLMSVNQTEISGSDALESAVTAARSQGRDSILLLVERDGNRRFIALDLAAS